MSPQLCERRVGASCLRWPADESAETVVCLREISAKPLPVTRKRHTFRTHFHLWGYWRVRCHDSSADLRLIALFARVWSCRLYGICAGLRNAKPLLPFHRGG